MTPRRLIRSPSSSSTSTSGLLLFLLSSSFSAVDAVSVSAECAAGLASVAPWSSDRPPRERDGTTAPAFALVRAWSEMVGSNDYVAFENACSALGDGDHVACTVSTTVSYDAGASSSSGARTADEVGKPVCLPPACDGADVDLLDGTTTLGCDGGSCAVRARETSCPPDRATTDETTCALAATTSLSDADLTHARRQAEKHMDARCVDTLHGIPNDVCPLATEDRKVTEAFPHNLVRDYGALKGNNFRELQARCATLGGALCEVDAVVERELTDTVVYEISKPVCFPAACDPSDTTDIDQMDPFPGKCDADSVADDICRVVSRTVRCPDDKPALNGNDCMEEYVALARDDDLRTKTVDLDAKVDRECIETMHGRTDGVEACDVVAPLLRSRELVFSDEVDAGGPVYDAFLADCRAVGDDAEVCTFSASVIYDDRTAGTFVKNSLGVVDLPVCVPRSVCSTASRRNLAYHSLFGSIAAVTDRCGPDGIGCDLRIDRSDCVDVARAPTSRPGSHFVPPAGTGNHTGVGASAGTHGFGDELGLENNNNAETETKTKGRPGRGIDEPKDGGDGASSSASTTTTAAAVSPFVTFWTILLFSGFLCLVLGTGYVAWRRRRRRPAAWMGVTNPELAPAGEVHNLALVASTANGNGNNELSNENKGTTTTEMETIIDRDRDDEEEGEVI